MTIREETTVCQESQRYRTEMEITRGLQVAMVCDKMADLVEIKSERYGSLRSGVRTLTQWFSLKPGRLKG